MLSPRRRRVYDFIRYYFLKYGYAPTQAEIRKHIGIQSDRTVCQELQKLVEDGLIKITPGKKRNLELVDKPGFCLPIIGNISAGKPIEPLEADQILDLTDLMAGSNRYVLKVVGDSMNGDNICNGDYVICEKKDTANDGDIIVALIDNKEATLKRLKRNSDKTITLLPSNPEHSPTIYKEEQIEIQGVYLGLIRFSNHQFIQKKSEIV